VDLKAFRRTSLESWHFPGFEFRHCRDATLRPVEKSYCCRRGRSWQWPTRIVRGESVQRDRDATRTCTRLLHMHVEEHVWKAPPMGEVVRTPTTMNRSGRDRDVCDAGRRCWHSRTTRGWKWTLKSRKSQLQRQIHPRKGGLAGEHPLRRWVAINGSGRFLYSRARFCW